MMNKEEQPKEERETGKGGDYQIVITVKPEENGHTVHTQDGLPGHPEFFKLLGLMALTHVRKNTDYSGTEEPLKNLKACEEVGLPAWKGVVVRMIDKWARIKQLTKEAGGYYVRTESMEDTLLDNAVYSLLCIVLRHEREHNAKMQVEPEGPKDRLFFEKDEQPKRGPRMGFS